MTVLVTPGELAELQALSPYLDIQPLPRQLEHAVCLYLRGMSITAAATAAGYSSTTMLNRWLKSDAGKAVLDYVQKKHMGDSKITRDQITQLFFEAHAKAANATEEISAVREIAKLHDLYENEKRKGNAAVNVQINNVSNVSNAKQLERMTDTQLLELAGSGLGALNGPGAIIDPEEEAKKKAEQDFVNSGTYDRLDDL